MLKTINNLLITARAIKSFNVIDVVLWIVLLFSSYHVCINNSFVFTWINLEEAFMSIFSFELLKFIVWSFVVVSLYFLLKFALSKSFVKSNLAFKLLLISIKELEIRRSFRNVYFHQSRARINHVDVVKSLTYTIGSEKHILNAKFLQKLLGGSLKILIIVLFNIEFFIHNSLTWLVVLAIIISTIIILISLYGILVNNGLSNMKRIIS